MSWFPKKVNAIQAVGLKHAPETPPNIWIIRYKAIVTVYPLIVPILVEAVLSSLIVATIIVRQKVPTNSAKNAYVSVLALLGVKDTYYPVAACPIITPKNAPISYEMTSNMAIDIFL